MLIPAKGNDVMPEGSRLDQGRVAADHALLLQTPDPFETGTRRKADPLGQSLVGDAPVVAERVEDH
jgi:hypothetical protein